MEEVSGPASAVSLRLLLLLRILRVALDRSKGREKVDAVLCKEGHFLEKEMETDLLVLRQRRVVEPLRLVDGLSRELPRRAGLLEHNDCITQSAIAS